MERQDVFLSMKSVIMDVEYDIDESKITENVSLKDLGISSINRVDILSETIDALGVSIKLVDFGAARNIGDVVTILHEKINHA